MPAEYSSNEPELYLPLERLETCASCKRTDAKSLKVCSSCGEVAYCSEDCQRRSWKSHKGYCGETDRIDFQSYYPFVAAVLQANRLDNDICQHPALVHKILNSPNPGSGDIVEFPNGTKAKLVILGEEIRMEESGSYKWWPTALSGNVRSKLLRRIVADGNLLPLVLATTLALVSEIYTTTWVPESEEFCQQFNGGRRVRLSYNRSPIADIGIAKGACPRVTPQDRLAFYNVDTNEFLMGQDPTNHYWIYFTTLHGQEYFLDCGMFTFNFATMVDVQHLVSGGLPPQDHAPALFYGRDIAKTLPVTDKIGWEAKERFSILRNHDLRDVLRTRDYEHCECHEIPAIYALLDKIAGRPSTDWEKKIVLPILERACRLFRRNVQERAYRKYPKEPQIGLELDPEERIRADAAEENQEDYACETYLKKWTHKLKKGKITSQQWGAAFDKWQAQPYERKMKIAGIAT